MIERAQAYVVRIDRGDGCASGVLLGRDGLVLTNYHVIRRAESLFATSTDGTRSALRVLTFDLERDLALLRATSPLPEPPPLQLAEDADLSLGEPIIVLGYPFPGSVSLDDCSESITVTRGILSGRLDILGQAVLQTDAPLNPGVSGGLAVTDEGAVAGLAVSGLNPDVAESVGFLIPASAIEARLEDWLPQLAGGKIEPPPEIDQIAFASKRYGDYDIFIMNVDGSHVRRLTDDPEWELSPDWSPDGAQIVFSRSGFSDEFGAGGFDIYVMNADGGNVRPLTNDSEASEPAWSPDGTRIAFKGSRDDRAGDIYVMDAGGGNVRRLTDSPGWDSRPSWSPDGTRIAFESQRDGSSSIYIMDADGGNVVRLTDDRPAAEPSWAPDGTQIVFVTRPQRNNQIYVIDADGRNTLRLQNVLRGGAPSWSPDGTRIAFESHRDGRGDIYVMDAEGGVAQRLTFDLAWDGAPTWSPGP